jgi:hypothetical protein
VKRVKLKYYKQPEGLNPISGVKMALTPRFGYTVVSNKEVFDATTSVDFELPEHFTPNIVMEIAKMIGINIKDSDMFTYASSEQTKQ